MTGGGGGGGAGRLGGGVALGVAGFAADAEVGDDGLAAGAGLLAGWAAGGGAAGLAAGAAFLGTEARLRSWTLALPASR